MPEGAPHQQKVPSDLTQIPIIWKYELLRYLRSKRLLASIAVAFVVIGLIYILPPALGHPYSGTSTDSEVTVVGLSSLGLPPGSLPYGSIGLLNHSGVDLGSIVVSVNGTVVTKGTDWFIAGRDGAPDVNVPLADVVLLFTKDLTTSNVTATYDWTTSAKDFESTFLNFANILIVICATFFGADAIVGEYQNRTGYLIFPNPVKRETLFFGKYAASMTAGIFVVALFYASITLLSMFTVNAADGRLASSFGFAVEYLVATTAIAYFISSILKGTTGATVLTFFLFIMILPIVDGVSMFSGVKISASVTFAAGVIQYIIQNPYPVDTSQTVPAGITIHSYYPDPTTAAITMLAYAIVAILLSLVLFRRKELAG
jgi:ABC-2 type transport system permease protein